VPQFTSSAELLLIEVQPEVVATVTVTVTVPVTVAARVLGQLQGQSLARLAGCLRLPVVSDSVVV
jgi:hypothetical protein